MCCCCPPAISALFCLYVQSGCSKSTVAGALTFFPPEPALYEFERHDKNGKILAEDELAATDDDEEDDTTPQTQSAGAQPDDDDDIGEIQDPARTSEPLELPETKGQTNEKIKSPIEQLTDQAAERRKRSKLRHTRDKADQAAGVTYKLLLDPRLQVPPHEDASIHALKIPTASAKNYVAAVLYQVPPERCTPHTRTLIYSHGNATDVGAMFPLQVVMAHSLDLHVLVYDYSGYGESGGVPDEPSTYRDIDAVYQHVLGTVAEGQPSRIVLYGQSVGSGPCCYLAAKLAASSSDGGGEERLGGMILHSPFTSGMRVLTPSRYVCVVACVCVSCVCRYPTHTCARMALL